MDWREHRYGTGATADLGYGLHLEVWYDGSKRLPPDAPKFNVRVFGTNLKERSADLESAKARAVRAAQKWLSEAQQQLST